MGSNKLVGIVLLVVGLLLLYFGLQASDSVGDQVSEAFTGRFTDETMWFIFGGVIAVVAGLYMAAVRK